MVKTISQCLLSQTDFDFISKANLVSDLGVQLETMEVGMRLGITVGSLFILVGFILIVFGIKMLSHDKLDGGLIIALVLSINFLMGFGVYSDLGSVRSLETEIAKANKEIQGMDKPDPELFKACRDADDVDAIVELAPNRDDPDFESSFESKIILD